MKKTAKQVALDLGISTATVSLAINNRPGVNEETRKRVLDYIRRMEEKENGTPSEKGSIKLLVYIRNQNFYDVAIGELFSKSHAHTCRMLQQENIEVKLFYVKHREEIEKILQESLCDGTLGIMGSMEEAPEDVISVFKGSNVPVVLSDAEMLYGDWDSVNLHNLQGIYQGMDYLRERGHREIVYFYNSETIYNFEKRRVAFRQYLREKCGMNPDEYMIEVGSSVEVIEERVRNYLTSLDKLPDAIFMENFIVSIGTIKTLQKMGLQIPTDISVLGIDDITSSAFFDIALTYLDVPHIGRSSVSVKQMLLKIEEQNSGDDFAEHLVAMRMVEGESVAVKG